MASRKLQLFRIFLGFPITLTVSIRTNFLDRSLGIDLALNHLMPSAFALSADTRDAQVDQLLAECEEAVQAKIPEAPDDRFWVNRAEQYAASLTPCHQTLSIYQNLNYRQGAAKTSRLLGIAYAHILENLSISFEAEERKEYFEKAVKSLQTSLGFYQESEDQPQEAEVLYRLGYVYREVRQYDQGLLFLRRALKLQSIHDSISRASTLYQMGLIYRGLKQEQRAIDAWMKVIPLAQSSQNLNQEGLAFFQLGLTYDALGQDAKALDALERYITLVREAKGTWAEASALQNLGRYYSAEERRNLLNVGAPTPLKRDAYVRGLAFYQRALDIYQSFNDLEQQVITLAGIGSAYYRQQRYDEAFATHLQALAVASSIEDRALQAKVLQYPLGTDIANYQVEHPEKAIKLEQQRLQIHRTNGDRAAEASSLSLIGHIYYLANQFKESLNFRQQAYAIYQELEDIESQARLLYSLGNMYLQRGVFYRYADTPCIRQNQYEQAIHFLQQSIEYDQLLIERSQDPKQKKQRLVDLAEKIREIAAESSGLACQHEEAIKLYQQALSIERRLKNQGAEAQTLKSIGDQALYAQQLDQALTFHQQALEILKTHHKGQARALLHQLVYAYRQAGYTEQAVQFSQLILEMARTAGDPKSEAHAFQELAKTYEDNAKYKRRLAISAEFPDATSTEQDRLFTQRPLSDAYIAEYERAIAVYQQALQQYRDLELPLEERGILIDLGRAYDALRQAQQADFFWQEALSLERRIGNRQGEAQVLENFGERYFQKEQYQSAIKPFQQALALYQTLKDQSNSASVMQRLGNLYRHLKQYESALVFYQDSYQIEQDLKRHHLRSWVLQEMGEIALELGRSQQALNFFQQAVAIHRQSDDRTQVQQRLADIGTIYLKRGELNLALEFHQAYLTLIKEQGDRLEEVNRLNHLANHYQWHSQSGQALLFYQQALVLSYQLQAESDFESFDGVGITLSGMGKLWSKQQRPELAITFYKAAVNSYETIRASYTGSDVITESDFAGIFLDKHSESYRSLADLLLEQGRILEAQSVLELLKRQEIRDYTRNARAIVTDEGIQYTPTEQQILNKHGSLIAFARKVAACELQNCSQASQLNQQREKLVSEYNQYINQIVTDIRARKAIDDAVFDPRQLGQNARKIVEAQPGTMLIYPVVLPEKLWLLWVAPSGIANRIEVPISQAELGKMAVKFRQLLNDPDSDIAELQRTGRLLYQWLIQPLQAELDQNQVKNLVFSLDRVTRYLPMGTLFDGQHYLIENYQISTILSAELTDIEAPRVTQPSQLPVLALGLSQAKSGFPPLPNVIQELDYIVREDDTDPQGTYPGKLYLDQDFDFRALADNIRDHGALHIATHGKFEPGLPEASYLVLGDGSRLNVSKINTLQNLSNIQLVVLSACETALGGPNAEGLEVAGLGYYFLAGNGAKAVIASLWLVNDASTSQLMQQFYQNLATGTMTKSEALQQAQIAMIHGKQLETSLRSRAQVAIGTTRRDNPVSTPLNYEHPYYWAPFILIGNGL
jgi:CHAT domain-containing protein